MATSLALTVVSTDLESITFEIAFDPNVNTTDFVIHRSILTDTVSAYEPIFTQPNVEAPPASGKVTFSIPIEDFHVKEFTKEIYVRALRVTSGNESPILASPTTIVILPTDVIPDDLATDSPNASVIFGRRDSDGAFVPFKAEDNGDGTFSLSSVASITGTVTVAPAGGSMPVDDNGGSLTIDTAGGNIGTNVHDGGGTAITSTVIATDTGLDVNVIGGINVEVDMDHTEDSVQVYGNDGNDGAGTNRAIKTDANGELQIDVLTSALPTGAATEATLSTVAGDTTSIDAKLVDGNDIGDVTVNNSGGASAVNIQDGGNSITVDATNLDIRDLTAASDSVESHLHDGAGTALTSTLVTGKQSLDVNVTSGINVEVDLDKDDDSVSVWGNDGVVNRQLKTDSDGHLQIDVLTSALPTGAATEATLSTLNAKFTSGTDIGDVTINNGAGGAAVPIQDGGNSITVDGTGLGVNLHDGAGTAITSTLITGDQCLDVNVVNALSVDVDLDESTDSVQVYGFDGVANRAIKTDTAGELQVDIVNPNTAPVYIANDSTGTLTVDDGGTTISVDDGGGALTVDGSVSVTNTVTVSDGGSSLTVDGAVSIEDTSGNGLTSTLIGAKQSLDVNIANTVPLEVNLSNTTDDVLVYGWDGLANQKIKTDAAGELQVDIVNPNTAPVYIANDSTGTLTVDDGGTTISVDDGGGALTVDGSVTATQSTHDNFNANANLQVGDADVANGNPVPVSDAGGSLTVDTAGGNLEVNLNDGAGTTITSTAGALDVNVASGDLTVDLDHTEDNIQIFGNDGNDGAGTNRAIKTNANGQLDIVATDLDIRDLVAATDAVSSWLKDGSGNSIGSTTGSLDVNITNSSVVVADGGSTLSIDDGGGSITVDGSVAIDDAATADYDTGVGTVTQTMLGIALPGSGGPVAGGTSANPLAVTATDLDIRDLSSASDSVAVLQATHDNLNANANIQVGDVDVDNANPVPISDAGGSLTVDAVNLDIRDLTAASDSVEAWAHDGTGTAITSTTGALDVNIKSGVTLTVDLDNANDDVLVYGWDGAANQKIKTDVNGELQVDVLSSALPTGAATESTLSTLNAKFTSGTDIGDVTINNAAGASAVNIQDGGNSITVDDGGASLTVDVGTALPAGTNNIGDVDIASAPTGASSITMQGTAADGAAVVGNPVLVAGFDGTLTQTLLTDSSGHLQIDVLSMQDGGNSISVDDGGGTLSIDDGGGSITVDVGTALPAGTNNIGDVDIASGPTGASALEIQGTAADGAAAVGDPVQIGGKDGSGNMQTIATDTDGAVEVTGTSISFASPTSATVGVASGAILASNSSRKYAIIVNDSDTDIYLGIGAAAVVGSGIRLNKNGGSYEINMMNLSTQAINGISTAASKNVTVHEAT